MALILGLLSLAALALFFAGALRRSSAITPLLAVAAAMLWFTVFGCLSLLRLAGWLWYIGCAAALAYTVYRHKAQVVRLFSAGFWLFLAGGLLFILALFFTRPMLTLWDEFTFWGTASKVVSETNLLYTLADSNLIARSYPPGLIVLNYMMQFFGPFTEYGLMASFGMVYLSAFAAGTAAFKRNAAGAVALFAAFAALPFLFEVGTAAGQMSYAYLACMADAPMAAFFGGALCLFFAGGRKTTSLLVAFCVALAALASMKDMGLALALLALFIAFVDILFCEREKLAFFRLRKTPGMLAFLLFGAALALGAYLLWAAHLALAPAGVNRFDLGSQGVSLSMPAMLWAGVQNLLGLASDAQYAAVLPMMLNALATEPVSMLGPGAVVFALIAFVLLCAGVLQTSVRGRRRVVVFALSSALGFVAFYVFNIFTYSFIFKEPEALILKDYARYIGPYWQAWLMASLVLLATAAGKGSLLRRRVQAARGLALVLSVLLVLGVAVFGNRQANVLRVSPALYGQRRSVASVVETAAAEGMAPEDVVYIISQGDDASRFYLFGYEMQARRSLLYDGPAQNADGLPLTDEAGAPVYKANAAVALTSPLDVNSAYAYARPCTPAQFTAFLKQEGCTHVLVDWPDGYILEEFAPLFSDGLSGWTVDDSQQAGHRYYRVVWNGEACALVPEAAAR